MFNLLLFKYLWQYFGQLNFCPASHKRVQLLINFFIKVYERLDDIGADTAEARASHLLRNTFSYRLQIFILYLQKCDCTTVN